MRELSIIVFAYNEANNIASVLGELRAHLERGDSDAEVIFVDDGSTDDSLKCASSALEGFPHTVHRHETNRGIGASIKTAVGLAAGRWVTFLPADGQIAPDAIDTLMAARTEDTDAVLSTYYDRDDGLHRTLLSAGVRALIWLVHGVRLRSDGPYLFRRALFIPDQLQSDTFFLNFEFPIRALAAGLQIQQVQIHCRPRQGGFSKTAALAKVSAVTVDLVQLRWTLAKQGLASLWPR